MRHVQAKRCEVLNAVQYLEICMSTKRGLGAQLPQCTPPRAPLHHFKQIYVQLVEPVFSKQRSQQKISKRNAASLCVINICLRSLTPLYDGCLRPC